MRAPKACNDNHRTRLRRTAYWVFVIGAMPTAGLLAALSTFLA